MGRPINQPSSTSATPEEHLVVTPLALKFLSLAESAADKGLTVTREEFEKEAHPSPAIETLTRLFDHGLIERLDPQNYTISITGRQRLAVEKAHAARRPKGPTKAE